MEPLSLLYLPAVLLVWLVTVGWTFRDASRRGSEYRFAWAGLVAVFFLPGLCVYLLVRLPWAVRHEGREERGDRD